MRTARIVQITEAEIEKLRKDWLNLAKSVKNVRSERDIETIRRGSIRWGLHLEDLWKQIREDVKGRARVEKNIDRAWLKHYEENQKELWELRYELVNPPEYESFDVEGVRRNLKNHMTSEEIEQYIKAGVEKTRQRAYGKWVEEARLWVQRTKKKAVAAWKWLKNFVRWTERSGFYSGGGVPAEWDLPDPSVVRLEGFQCMISGYNPNKHSERMEWIKDGLRLYRKLASSRFPWMLKKQLPFEIHFSDRGDKFRDAAATYNKTHIAITPWGTIAKSREFVRILAHEMGHHLWQSVLSGSAQEFWVRSIRGDYGPLDLRMVIKRMRAREDVWDFRDRIKKEDPILHLQIEGLYEKYGFGSIRDIKEAVEGGMTIVQVPKNPITGYATKNPEEAFCETLGMLVGFGPRALLPEIKRRLKLLVPNVRLSRRGV